VFGKQTLRELSEDSGYSRTQLQNIFHALPAKEKMHNPRPINLVVDTTFFGSKKAYQWGVTVFRDAQEKENLWWKFVTEERLSHYWEGKEYLGSLGYTFLSVTCDGFSGLVKLFSGIPVQFCHFHQKQIIRRYVTQHPREVVGHELLDLVSVLTYTTQPIFTHRLSLYIEKYRSFLNEMTPNLYSHKTLYTHKKLRSAIFSIQRNLPYLFTYQKYSTPSIPPTTNTLEGHYSHIKDVVRIHRGLSLHLKQKMIHSILLNSSIAKKKNPHP